MMIIIICFTISIIMYIVAGSINDYSWSRVLRALAIVAAVILAFLLNVELSGMVS